MAGASRRVPWWLGPGWGLWIRGKVDGAERCWLRTEGAVTEQRGSPLMPVFWVGGGAVTEWF